MPGGRGRPGQRGKRVCIYIILNYHWETRLILFSLESGCFQQLRNCCPRGRHLDLAFAP